MQSSVKDKQNSCADTIIPRNHKQYPLEVRRAKRSNGDASIKLRSSDVGNFATPFRLYDIIYDGIIAEA
jgi:hypothetical protein